MAHFQGSEALSGEAPSGEAPSGEAPSGEAPSGEAPSGEAPSGGVQNNNGLDREGYHYAHGQQYYVDGRICPPPAICAPEDKVIQASQSRWNAKDYHWEERDILQVAQSIASRLLVGIQLWHDKRSEDALQISACRVEGWATSNIRKGTTKNLFELNFIVAIDGSRGGAELNIIVSCDDINNDHLGAEASQFPEFKVESKVGSNLIKEKVVAPDGEITLRITGEVDSERAMRSNEMFLKLVRQKGLPVIQEKITEMIKEISTFGQLIPLPT